MYNTTLSLGLELDVASAMFNGTNCGIDVTTDVKKQCHGKDNCQIYAPTIGNSGCNPGTSTLWVQYSCAGTDLFVLSNK